jgi:hypothetical protein
LYSARHFLELKLKELLQDLVLIDEIIGGGFKKNVDYGHSISNLWKLLTEITDFEGRYKELINRTAEYVEDFAEIDDNGEAFRYPYSTKKEKYLTKIDCVDLGDFYARFRELCANLEELSFLTQYLVEEYNQKSFIGRTSREEIKRIAVMLGPFDTWGAFGFLSKKNEVKEKFKLSSTKLSKVISFIKDHKEFSRLIGLEIPIEELDSGDIICFFQEYDRYKENYLGLVNSENLIKSINRISRKFQMKKLAALSQLYEMGYYRLFSEEYEKGLGQKLKEEKFELIRKYLLNNGIVKDCIINGLISIGQTTILAKVKVGML